MFTAVTLQGSVQVFCGFSVVYVVLKILLQLWSLFSQYLLPKFRSPPDYKQYGKWAVITGSTDGIGKGFAKELARKGLDICLISRNEKKLIDTAKEIERFGVNTKYIVADFTDENVYDHIRQNIKQLDIGILVNNVGMMSQKRDVFSEQSEDFIKNIISVNVLAGTMMTSIIIPRMISKRRGLIINVSSALGEWRQPYAAVYSATKAYITALGTCLNYELKAHNIQMTTLLPVLVYTPLVRAYCGSKLSACNRLLPGIITTVENYVPSALEAITSHSDKTCGYLIHQLYLMLFGNVPINIMAALVHILFGE